METIKVEDRNTIINIVFKHPSLMKDTAAEEIKNWYENIYIPVKKELQGARNKVRRLEQLCKDGDNYWREIQQLITYEHPIVEEKEAIHETSSLTIQGHGNDIIGKTTVM